MPEHLTHCPYWLPRDPNVLHKDRKQCVLFAGHPGDHRSISFPIYVIEETPELCWTE